MYPVPYTSAEIGICYPELELQEQPEVQLSEKQPTGLELTSRLHSVITELDMIIISMILDAGNLDSHMNKQHEANKRLWALRDGIYDIARASWNDGFVAGNDGLSF